MERIGLKSAIYAHHHGYRFVAKTPSLSNEILDAIIAQQHHVYFLNKSLEESVLPLKFRHFVLNLKGVDHYVCARIEPKHDVITHRGMVSAAQFFIIDTDSVPPFLDIFQANICNLMALIPFYSIDVGCIGQGDVIPLDPLSVECQPSGVEKLLFNLKEKLTDKEMSVFYSNELISSIESGNRVCIRSRKFDNSIDIFNIFCRGLFALLPVCWRNKLTFSTAELSSDFEKYSIVFLHKDAPTLDDNSYNKECIIDLDATTTMTVAWYLIDDFSDTIDANMKFISNRIVKKDAKAIEFLGKYKEIIEQEIQKDRIKSLNGILDDFKDHYSSLWGNRIVSEILDVTDSLLNGGESYHMVELARTYSYLCEIVKQSVVTDSWNRELEIKFVFCYNTLTQNLLQVVDKVPAGYTSYGLIVESLDSCNENIIGEILTISFCKKKGIATPLTKYNDHVVSAQLDSWLTVISRHSHYWRNCSEDVRSAFDECLTTLLKNIPSRTMSSKRIADQFSLLIAGYANMLFKEEKLVHFCVRHLNTLIDRQEYTGFILLLMGILERGFSYEFITNSLIRQIMTAILGFTFDHIKEFIKDVQQFCIKDQNYGFDFVSHFYMIINKFPELNDLIYHYFVNCTGVPQLKFYQRCKIVSRIRNNTSFGQFMHYPKLLIRIEFLRNLKGPNLDRPYRREYPKGTVLNLPDYLHTILNDTDKSEFFHYQRQFFEFAKLDEIIIPLQMFILKK